MQETDESSTINTESLEADFTQALAAEPLPFPDLMASIRLASKSGRADVAEAWAERLQTTLAARALEREAVELLRLRAGWHGQEQKFRAVCRDALEQACKTRTGMAFVAACGLDKDVAPAESLRRLHVLLSLKPGLLCHEKSWGFGRVNRVDDFYQKIIVDFTRKAGHPMSFAYAAETLELIADDHLLAHRHRHPEEFAALLREDPAEVVRMAVRSFGPISVNRLREVFADEKVVPDAGWKPFWEAARARLKKDSKVDIPASRDNPIRLLAQETSLASERVAQLRKERDTETIVELITKLDQEAALEGQEAVVIERLTFALHAATGRDWQLAARIAMLAKQLTLGLDRIGGATLLDDMMNAEVLLRTATDLTPRDLRRFLHYLGEHDRDRECALLLGSLHQMHFSVLDTCMEYLIKVGKAAEAARAIEPVVRKGEARLEVLLWLCRNLDFTLEHAIATLPELLKHSVDIQGGTYTHRRLQALKHFRQMFESKAWFEDILGRLDPKLRENFLLQVQGANAWDEEWRRTSMAVMIRVQPDLQKVLTAGVSEPEAAAGQQGRFTSWRSLKTRQEQFKKLVEEDIPANSKEIGVARSYGDLRENAEFKAAKEHQGVLMRRRDDWEQDLKQIMGTDFAGVPTDKAGPGTTVTLRRPDGRTERMVILGEWDGDEAMGVVSSRSDLARRLFGHKAGDTVSLPGPGLDEACVIVDIGGLAAEIVAWIRS